MAFFDTKGGVLLLRRAGDDTPAGLWEFSNRAVEDGENPDRAALQRAGEASLHGIELTGQEGSFDGGTTRHLIFSARVGRADIVPSPTHDAYTWRYADALPAVSREPLDLLRDIASAKPRLAPDEWQNTLPHWHVGANALVRDQGDRILIVRPDRSKTWQLPGGQVDAHETLIEAAVRELREETGLVLPAGPLLAMVGHRPVSTARDGPGRPPEAQPPASDQWPTSHPAPVSNRGAVSFKGHANETGASP
ncbi:NUDIX hydrolase [Streptomyces sp. NPDC046924]|uniref:NUDIX hydrolase n=1 Tax=Streptomyces sp. NPDC046924 TaxID=3155136 RepID=UPI0033DAB259